MALKPKGVESAVLACCCLHNLLRLRRPASSMHGADVEDPDSHNVIEGQWRRNVLLTAMDHQPLRGKIQYAPKSVRNYLMEYYNSPVGAVSWQDRAIDK